MHKDETLREDAWTFSFGGEEVAMAHVDVGAPQGGSCLPYASSLFWTASVPACEGAPKKNWRRRFPGLGRRGR